MVTHAYLKYAMALLMEENNLSDEREISFDLIKREIGRGLDAFCVRPNENFEGKEYVNFCFVNEPNKAPLNIYLSPNAIATEMNASNLYKAAKKVCDSTKILDLEKKDKVTQSQIPTVGEFCAFSDSGNIGRGKPDASNLSICLGLITSTTPLKPCLQYMSGGNGKVSTDNVCLIPDMDIPHLVDFINLFKRLRLQKLPDLMVGKVEANKGKSNVIYKPKRPLLFRGNFPNAPRSSALGAIALLGVIGEMVKESDVSDLALNVLESFKGKNFYAFKYGDAQVYHFNHYIIDLAKEGRLRSVVDCLYYVLLYNQGPRRTDNTIDYQKFDLFASRFLQLFNRPAFQDFLAFRAEYPSELEVLLKSYFIQMEHINEDVVMSAKALGHWLNLVAYKAAKKEISDNKSKEKIREVKAKVLVELESSIFSAKSADALIAHTLTRAGRLSATDAPAEASLFIEKVACGDLPLEQAKNLLIAFSRLRPTISNGVDLGNVQEDYSLGEMSEQETTTTDYSNI